MTAWVGKPETSPGQAGTEQLQHLAWVLGPGRVLPGGRVEGEVTRKAPSQPQLLADVSGQCLRTTLALGDFCPQRRLGNDASFPKCSVPFLQGLGEVGTEGEGGVLNRETLN